MKKKDEEKGVALKAILNIGTICLIVIMLIVTLKFCFWLLTGRW